MSMIEALGLTKIYGRKKAVDDLTFTVKPGVVTGFLGPNGAGKSTTMRMILGLDSPSAGSVRVNGKLYREHSAPLHEVGALLEARSIHTGRSAYNHLLALAQTGGISRARVEEVIDLVGLREVARKRAGSFSLGMGQRLGIASALLGDPHTLILDEPVNGLDPEGVVWVRNLVRFFAAVKSEWIKFATVRSTVWTLAITLATVVGIVTLFSAVVASRATENDARSSSIFVFSIAADLAQLAVVVLGAAVPARLPVL